MDNTRTLHGNIFARHVCATTSQMRHMYVSRCTRIDVKNTRLEDSGMHVRPAVRAGALIGPYAGRTNGVRVRLCVTRLVPTPAASGAYCGTIIITKTTSKNSGGVDGRRSHAEEREKSVEINKNKKRQR